MSNTMVELLNNAEVGRLIGTGRSTHNILDVLTGIDYNVQFAGRRDDHYDVTPTTPQDMDKVRRINNGTLTWLARPILLRINGRLIAAGAHSFMHGSIIGGGNPGPGFSSRSDNGPFNTPNGGHFCIYFVNSVGGTTSATALPAANNSLASALANQRAGTPNARGRRSRAGAHEAYIRGNQMFNDGNIPMWKDPPLAILSPVLRQGVNNQDAVRELQTLLNRHGATPQLSVDGRFGPLTDAAVRNFQSINSDINGRPLVIDGVVGPLTWSSLRSDVPDITFKPTPVSYRLMVTGSSVNIRTGPGTDNSAVTSVSMGTEFNIDAEHDGPDGKTVGRWARIADGEHLGHWIIIRLTQRMDTDKPLIDCTVGNSRFPGNSTIARIWNAIVDADLPGISNRPEHIAGIIGNLQSEAGVALCPFQQEVRAKQGIGLMQWSFARRTALEEFMWNNGINKTQFTTEMNKHLNNICNNPIGAHPTDILNRTLDVQIGFMFHELRNTWERFYLNFVDHPTNTTGVKGAEAYAELYCVLSLRPGSGGTNDKIQDNGVIRARQESDFGGRGVLDRTSFSGLNTRRNRAVKIYETFLEQCCSASNNPPAPTPAPSAPVFQSYQVTVTTNRDPLNVRSAPTNAVRNVVGSVARGSPQTILEERSGPGSARGWGRILFNKQPGWIALDHTTTTRR